MRYVLFVTESGPLSFRTGRETVNTGTLPYVPGTSILGGLAQMHTMLRRDADQFSAFFLTDGVSFGNLYPSPVMPGAPQDDLTPVYPLPVTARTCKRFGGFLHDEDDPQDEPHHGVWDALIPWALFALSEQTQAQVLDPIRHCPHPDCQEPLDRFDGFYRRGTSDALVMSRAQVERGLRTRTGIQRATGTVQQGILYSREVLRAGTNFWGTLTVPDEHAQAFEDFVRQVDESDLLHVGNNRTRGFGRVKLALAKTGPQDSLASLRQRVNTFDTQLRHEAQAAGIPTPHALYLLLTLTSDTILLDRLLRYRGAIETDYLAETWDIPNAELVYQNSGTRRVMGWSDLWGLPRADQVAITKGAVFVLGLSQPPDDELLQTLLRMQTEGIGARRREGFGRLWVASPFHWEVKGV